MTHTTQMMQTAADHRMIAGMGWAICLPSHADRVLSAINAWCVCDHWQDFNAHFDLLVSFTVVLTK